MPPISIAESLFELLELPDGRWCVAKPAPPERTLIAGSFARLPLPEPPASDGPVGFYASRDAAELAIQRATPASADPFALFAALLQSG